MTHSQSWFQLSVEADHSSADDLANLLGRHCAGGAVVEEAVSSGQGPRRVTVKGYIPAWDEEMRRKLEIALLLLAQVSPISEPQFTLLQPEDWSSSWKAFFPPLPIGQRLVIVPTWCSYDAQPGQVIIRLDPGMAFGTGLHPTTRLCLIGVERCMRPGLRVLDVGCGSGILAIAAALLGAGHVEAIDIDPVAVHVAQDNAALNGVDALVSTRHASLIGDVGNGVPVYAPTDVQFLLVNIFAEVIIQMAEALAKALAKGGAFVASGILAEKAEAVVEALEAVGLHVEEHLSEEGWVALIGRRP